MRANNRVYLRSDLGISLPLSRISEVESDTETAPAGALTPNEGLTEPLGGSAVSQDSNIAKLRRQILAVEHLELCRDKLDGAKRARIVGIAAAREHGLSHQTIAEALGISESAVRGLIERHAAVDRAECGRR
jgi:DNA-directed RNA polymerase specialized sigma24 family protein